MGVIRAARTDRLEMIEFRWDIIDRLSSKDRYEDAITVAPPDEATEFRVRVAALALVLSAKVSRSKFSACTLKAESSCSVAKLSLKGTADASVFLGRKGTSMLDNTSCSSKPSICISCILARVTNLCKSKVDSDRKTLDTYLSCLKGRSICLSQNVTEVQNGSHQKVVISRPFESPTVSSPPHRGSMARAELFPSRSVLSSGSTPWKLKIGH